MTPEPLVFPNFLSPQKVAYFIDLCLQAAHQDLAFPSDDPTTSSFMFVRGQGIVLRTGVIHELWKGITAPHVSTTRDSIRQTGEVSLTQKLIFELESLLPKAQFLGMLLIRITNFPIIATSMIPKNQICTPWHVDKPQYGNAIWSTALTTSSAIIFAKNKNHIVTAIPDMPGSLTFVGGPLRYFPFFHSVTSSGDPRISITWRPNPITPNKNLLD